VGLEENVLNDRQLEYLAWLCTPPAERQPASKTKYAVERKVAPETLRRWEKLESFRKEWQSRVDELVGSPERTQTLLDRLYKAGLEGDVRSAELFFKVTGRMAPAQVTVTSAKGTSELSDEELDQLIAQRAVSEKKLRAVG
jgi:hypothetical protein